MQLNKRNHFASLLSTPHKQGQRITSKLKDCQKQLTTKAIVNIIDINNKNNVWYDKWLCPSIYPITCIFSASSKLIDIIPGSSKESFLYIKQSLKTFSTSGYHFPNQLNIDKEKCLPILSSVLQHKLNIDNGIYSPSDIESVIDSLRYPFPLFLKIVGSTMIKDSVAAKKAATELLKLKDPYNSDLYKNEFIMARKILDKNYTIITDANIRIDKHIIKLNNCIVNKSIEIPIPVHNEGRSPLIISKLHMSCSCIKSLKIELPLVINAKKKKDLIFTFTPDMEGELHREIFIISNAINTPILYIQISAFCKLN